MGWWDGVSVRGRREDGTVREIRIRQGARQSLQVMLAIGAMIDAQQVPRIRTGHPVVIAFMVGYPFLLLALGALGSCWSPGTTLTEWGLECGRTIPWSAVCSVGLRKSWGSTRIVIGTADGRTRVLKGAVTGFPYDPDFDRKLHTLLVWWSVRSGRPGVLSR